MIFYTYWYLTAVPELMAITAARFEHLPISREMMMRRQAKPLPSFPALVQASSSSTHRNNAPSPQTVAAYRDAFMPFLALPRRTWMLAGAAQDWPKSRRI